MRESPDQAEYFVRTPLDRRFGLAFLPSIVRRELPPLCLLYNVAQRAEGLKSRSWTAKLEREDLDTELNGVNRNRALCHPHIVVIFRSGMVGKRRHRPLTDVTEGG